MVSFGFKYGLPLDADLVVDVRFLPNPYWIPELRDHTGQDARGVATTCCRSEGATEFLDRYAELLDLIGAGYQREGKRYLTLAVGCTGGKHRSVAIAEELRRAAGRRTRSRSRSSTATWAGSERARRARPAAGGRARRRPRPARRCSARCVRLDRRHHRGGHGRRRRRVVRPAAPRAAASCRRATCGWRWPRWPATTTGARTVEPTCCSTASAATGALAGHPVGNLLLVGLMRGARRPGRRAGRGRRAARRARPGAADGLRAAGHRRRGRRAATRATRPRSAGSAARSRSRPRPAGCGRCALAPPGRRRPARRRSTRDRARPTGSCFGPGSWFTSVLPHLLVPELAAAIAASRGAPAGRAQPGRAAGRDRRASPRSSTCDVLSAARCPACGSTSVLADSRLGGPDRSDWHRLRRALGARLVLAPDVPPPTGRRGTTRHGRRRPGTVLRGVAAGRGSSGRTGPSGERTMTAGSAPDGDDRRGQGRAEPGRR